MIKTLEECTARLAAEREARALRMAERAAAHAAHIAAILASVKG